MSKVKTISLVVGGFVAGAMISLHLPALADKDAKSGLPIDELRTFAEVYSGIKQGYVEPVEDKTMINNAISGMLSNLDPHSAYLDADAFKDLQVGTQGEFGGLGVPMEGHLWWTDKKNWGYQTFQSQEALQKRYGELMEQLLPLVGQGLSAAIYTQTTDVEAEVNGLLTYDREVVKFNPQVLSEWHARLYRQPGGERAKAGN